MTQSLGERKKASLVFYIKDKTIDFVTLNCSCVAWTILCPRSATEVRSIQSLEQLHDTGGTG